VARLLRAVSVAIAVLVLILVTLNLSGGPIRGQAVFVNHDDVGYIAVSSDSVVRYSLPRRSAVVLTLAFDGVETIVIARRDCSEVGRVTMTRPTVRVEIRDEQIADVVQEPDQNDLRPDDIRESPYCKTADFGLGSSDNP
jgi:hypothetical protein